MDLIDCEGSPRALGLDQGRACASEIRDWLRSRGLTPPKRLLRSRLAGGATLGAGVGREVVRHYPHLVERMSGVARAAGVAIDALMEDLVASAYGDECHPLTAPVPAVAAASADGHRVLARSMAASTDWIVRRSRPEIGFASIEVTAPWLVGAVGGVNEAGLSAMTSAAPSERVTRGVRAAPGWLLVQECLQRFDSLQASIEWCLRRPSGGTFSLLLGEGSGEVAVVAISEHGRELRHRGSGGTVSGGAADSMAALNKRLASSSAFESHWLAEDGSAGAAPSQLWLRPVARRLEWRPSDGAAEGWQAGAEGS